FNAEWTVLSACAMGAPHARERLFILAHPAVDDVPSQMPHSAEPAASGRNESRGSDRGTRRDWWLREPAVDRVAHGATRSMVYDELHALGNAVVPQVAEHIGELIMQAAA